MMTDDRKRKTGGEVELLALPVSYGDHCTQDSVRTMREPGWTAEQMRDYARANVDRALAESRAEVAELKACNHGLVRLNEATLARAERLAGLLREAVGWNWLDDDPPVELGQRIDAALNLEPTP